MKMLTLLLNPRQMHHCVDSAIRVSKRPPQRISGFSLLEVLISIIILSFGLLGMVGMQAAALQANKEARYQSVGVRYAAELAEIMRGNKDVAVLTAAADNPYLISFSEGDTINAAPTNCFTADCYSNPIPAAAKLAIAQFQVQDWLQRSNSEIPGLRVVVCFDNAPYDASGFPRWACDATGASVPNTVIKIGWTRGSTNRSTTGAAAFEKATVPSVMMPVTPGSAT